MKKNFAIILLVIISFNLKAQQEIDTSASKPLFQKLDEFLISLSNVHKFNGSVLIAKKGHILLHKGYGWKNAAVNTFNDSNTIFQIGSNTKPFTATAILELQERGKLSLQDKLSKYFPDYPNGNKITIENLITHTSGIPSYDVDETDTVAWTPVSKIFILDIFEHSPLEFDPGTKYKYSNAGYFLLGMIIEKVTGKSYEQAIRDMIFEPLQMTHSGFDFINLKDTLKTIGYARISNSEQIVAHLIDSTVSYSAGAMYSTTDDLYKWVKSIANRQLLLPDTWKNAFTPFKENYGYGWFIDSMNGQKYIGHPGGIMGFSSYVTYFPQEDVAIILLNNLFDETNPIVLPVQDLSAIIFNKPYSLYHEKKVAAISDSILNNYIGTYSLSDKPKRTMIIAKENNQLVLIIYGKTTLHMVFQTDTKFQLKELSNVDGEFILSNGKVAKMIISQNGLFEWIKMK